MFHNLVEHTDGTSKLDCVVALKDFIIGCSLALRAIAFCDIDRAEMQNKESTKILLTEKIA